MIDVDERDNEVSVWRREPASGYWQLVARGPCRLGALVDAERIMRAELTRLQELLHQAKVAERRCDRP